MSMKAMTPSQVKEFVTNNLLIRRIPYVAGPPGIGKSDTMFQIADDFNLKILDIRLSQMLPEDLTGLPSLDQETGKATYNPFDTFPMEGDSIPDGYDGWLIFLDELSSATDEIWAAIYSLLLGHMIGGKKVHSKALIVAAGNRSTDSGIARPLPDTLITRMMPCEMKVSSKDWLKWAKETNQHDMIQGFIKKYPDMLIGNMDPSKREELETYNTPRGWGTMSEIVKLHERNSSKKVSKNKDSAGIPVDNGVAGTPITPAIQAMMFSAVGVMAATSFRDHYNETMQLPFPWDVAQSPMSVKIPGTTMGQAKLTADLAEYFIEAQDQARDSILKFMNRMDKEHSAMFTHMIQEALGNTTSDNKLVVDVKERLAVTDIDIDKRQMSEFEKSMEGDVDDGDPDDFFP